MNVNNSIDTQDLRDLSSLPLSSFVPLADPVDFSQPLLLPVPQNQQLLPHPVQETLADATLRLQQSLVELKAEAEFAQILETTFGEGVGISEATTLIDAYIAQTQGPDIQVVEAEVLEGDGAFGDRTIFISDQLLGEIPEAKSKLDMVLLEEFGHYLDQELNPNDTPGDEGELFAKLVQHESISEIDRLRIKNDQDHSTLVLPSAQDLTSQAIAVEQSNSRSLYEIQAGDTLWAIAEQYLGAGVRWTELQKEDGSTFIEAEASTLQIGQSIYIPSDESASSDPPPVPEPPISTPADSPEFQAYTLVKGDTLWDVAQRELGEGRRWVEFLKEDGSTFTEAEATSLHPGDVIYIPGSVPVEEPLSPEPVEEPVNPPSPSTPSSDNGIEYGTYSPNVDQAFLNKVAEISGRLGAVPEYLIAVMGFETAGTYSPSIRNFGGSGATGLIQFMEQTAINLGTTTAELAAMNAIEQLDYVEQYLQFAQGRLDSLEDTYMAVLWPAAVGKDPNQAIITQGDRFYSGNSGLDVNNDGAITPREAADKVRDFLPEATLFGDSEAVSSTPPSSPITPPIENEPNYLELVPLPDKAGMSPGLTTPNEDFMLSTVGNPNLGGSSFEYQDLIETRNVGPFTVTGLRPMLEDLQAIFAQVKAERPKLYDSVQEIGLFYRRRKKDSSGNERPGTISSHSWGTAIDLYFGEGFDLTEDGLTNRGLIDLAPYFHERGYVWGARFSNFEDPGHFEASQELILEWQANGWTSVDPIAGPLPTTTPTSPTAYPGYILNYEAGQSISYDANVERWQQQMQSLGWDIVVDGKYGPQSQGVALRFQALYPELENDGMVGPQTWAMTFSADAKGPVATPSPTPAPAPSTPPTPEPSGIDETLQVGDRGSSVEALQENLIDFGYELPLGGADGIYGEETANAVQTFHRDHGLGFQKSTNAQTWVAFDWKHFVNPEQSTYPNDALSTATDISLQNDGVNVQDSLGYQRSRYEYDRQDVYRVNLTQSENVDLYIGGAKLKGDLQLTLLNSAGERIQSADTLYSNRIQTNLAAGEYYVEISSVGSGGTPYRLNLSTSTASSSQPSDPQPPTPQPPSPPTPNPVPFPRSTTKELTFDLDFETENQSMWNSGRSFSIEESLFFGKEWDESGSFKKAGFGLGGSTEGKAGLQAEFAINSGSVSAELPIDVNFTIPNNIRPGDTITILSSYDIDEDAYFETVSPLVDAALDLIFELDASVNASIPGKDFELFDADIAEVSVNLLDIGEEKDKPKEEDSDKTEEEKDEGFFDKFGSLDFSVPSINTRGDFTGNRASAAGDDDFLSATLDLDGIASVLIPPVPPLEFEFDKFGFEGSFNLADIEIAAQLLANQAFELYLDAVDGLLILENGDELEFTVGDSITYQVPDDYDFGSSLEIETLFNPDTSFSNETGLAYDVNLDLSALSASAKGNLPWPLPDVKFEGGPIFEKSFDLFDGEVLTLYDQKFDLKGWNSESRSFEIAIA